MQDKQQYEQLMLQYEQLKAGADDILRLIESEEYDIAMTMIKSRESVFLNCKCMRNYLEMTEAQEKAANALLDEIRALEKRNIEKLTESMSAVEKELKTTQKTEKIQNAYAFDNSQKGSIINIQDIEG